MLKSALLFAHVLFRKRQQNVLEVKEKVKKLEESAGLRDQRQMYERAALWAAVERLQALLAEHAEVEQVGC